MALESICGFKNFPGMAAIARTLKMDFFVNLKTLHTLFIYNLFVPSNGFYDKYTKSCTSNANMMI